MLIPGWREYLKRKRWLLPSIWLDFPVICHLNQTNANNCIRVTNIFLWVKQCETYNMYVDILPVARVDICNPGTQTAPRLSGNLLLKTKTHTENDAWFFLDNLYVKTCLEPIKRVESCRLFGAMSKSTDPASSARSESSFLRPAGDHHACLKPATQKAVSSNANRTVGIS